MASSSSSSGDQFKNIRDYLNKLKSEQQFPFANVAAAPTMSIKLDNLTKLKGQENYQTWAKALKYVLKSQRAYEVVVEGYVPNDAADEQMKLTYKVTQDNGLAILIQSLTGEILNQLPEDLSAHEIWVFLRDSYFQDAPINFYGQLRKVFTLSPPSSTSALTKFLTSFEEEWALLLQLAKSTTDKASSSSVYRQQCHAFLANDMAKRDFLFALLAEAYPNEVDNLSTKESLSYTDVKNKFMSIPSTTSSKSSSGTALTAKKNKSKGKPSASTTSSSKSPEQETCTWCAKHHPSTKVGHNYKVCRNRKKQNGQGTSSKEDKKKEKKKTKKDEGNTAQDSDSEANVVSANVRTHSWIFDTGASTHMSPDTDKFINLKKGSYGSILIGDGTRLEIEGIGSVLLSCLSPSGTVNSVELKECYYVPKLKKSLFSWSKAKASSLVYLEDRGDLLVKLKSDNSPLLWAVRKPSNNLFEIKLAQEHTANLTFRDVHENLGHPSLDIMRYKEVFADGDVVPKSPKSFDCKTCMQSKSTHRKPPSRDHVKASTNFELIHSDIHGPFPCKSLGGKHYYVTFIDDKSRYIWVRFLTRKSEFPEELASFLKLVQTQYQGKVQRLRSDNGGEYSSSTVSNILKENGILHEFTPPYSHESNGLAERVNRTIITMVRSMTLDMSLTTRATCIGGNETLNLNRQ